MSQSLTFHFSKKKERVYKNLFAKRSHQTVQHVAVSFSFCTALLLHLPLFSLPLPSLSPSTVRLPPQHFSSDKQSPSCFPKQVQRAAINLSHLIWVFAFFPGRRRRIVARVDSEPWNNNSKKTSLASCRANLFPPFSNILGAFGPQICLRAVSISGSHKERQLNLSSFRWQPLFSRLFVKCQL